jgi:hypothetical protein
MADPYKMVTKSEREDYEKLSEAEINGKIAEIAKNNAALEEAKTLDEDLAKAKAAVSVAGEVYRDGAKANKQRIAYLRYLLGEKGKPNGDAGLDDESEEEESGSEDSTKAG